MFIFLMKLNRIRGVSQVPKEESIAEIRDRYMDINSHAASYNWKALKSSPGGEQVQFCCILTE